jgi:wyosine [tRNA(Phe)-imidazoG37] synthetase (radical SAM superfamily)
MNMQMERQTFYQPEEILSAVQDKVVRARKAGESIDYLTFVPEGEPTLDLGLGDEIDLLRQLEIPIAVITNSSLIWREDVREALMKADWVSLKIDSTREEAWHRISRPPRTLQLASILNGMLEFAKAYNGELATETMMVKGINDSDDLFIGIADFLARLQPARAYLAIPTRPPAEAWVRPPGEDVVNRAYQVFSKKVARMECLIGYEGNAFAFTGNVEEDLLSITAVHPMREKAVREFLTRAGKNWSVVNRLIARDQLLEIEYGGHKFYLRKLRESHKRREVLPGSDPA